MQYSSNCNYNLFIKLSLPGNSEGSFRSSSQAFICPPVYHTRWRLRTVSFFAERQARKLWIPIFIIFGLTRSGIEPESTISIADTIHPTADQSSDRENCLCSFSMHFRTVCSSRHLLNRLENYKVYQFQILFFRQVWRCWATLRNLLRKKRKRKKKKTKT